MYFDFIRSKFPQSPNLGLYAAPNLPAVKLGKILLNDSRVKQPGDVAATYADTSDLARDLGITPHTSIEEGVKRFVEWYTLYYGS